VQNNLDTEILKDQLALLKRQLWIVIGGNLGASAFFAVALWFYSNHTIIIIWISSIYGWTILRGLILFRFTSDASVNVKLRLFMFLSFISGVL